LVPANTDPDLTLHEAVTVLPPPPITAARLGMIVRGVGLQPCGARHTGKRGHPRPTYLASEILRLHAAVARWLTG
jgi:hypothetical protein